jgi:flagellar hook-associated protein 3 FlgL
MRISTGQQFQNFSSRISETQGRLAEAQDRVSTGRRFQRASEDPASAGRVVRLSGLRARIDRLQTNVQHGSQRLAAADDALGGINDVAVRARTLALQAANPGLPKSSREAIASELGELKDRLISLGNEQDAAGQHIFAGRNSGEKPFAVIDGELKNRGDGLPVRMEARPGEQMDLAIAGAPDLVLELAAEIDQLRSDAAGGHLQQLGEDRLNSLDQLSDRALSLRAEAGLRMGRLNAIKEEHAKRLDDLEAQRSEVQDVDLAVALTELKSAELAYTASLQTISQGMNLSLMDFLR